MTRQHEFNDNERGIALIAALLVSTILLALGLAVALSATTDTIITKSHRVSEQAFFAADAGVAIARRSLATALQEEILRIQRGEAEYGEEGFVRRTVSMSGGFPDIQVIPDPDDQPDHPFYKNVYARIAELATVEGRRAKLEELNGTSFTVNTVALSGTVVLSPPSGNTAVEATTLRYSIEVTGTTRAGGRATVIESGLMGVNLTLSGDLTPPTGRNFAFSGFGAFFDDGDTAANSALASGTFSGIVHTNTHFAFQSNRNVIFRNAVSQADSYIRYDSTNFNQGHRAIPTSDIQGIDISAEGYKRVAPVPLPGNNFSQEYAVINATGITAKNPDGTPVDPPAATPVDISGNLLPVFDLQGRVIPLTLAENLRAYNNAKPGISGGNLSNGVYISSANGTSITGAGIYVQGNADDIKLVAQPVSGGPSDQLYILTQGSTTTTIRVSERNNQTTITRGSTSTTFAGVPTDRSDPASPKPGVSLFVNGTINSLRGGVDGSLRQAAIASSTRLTITAQRDIKITGDIKYEDTVVNSDGTPVGNLSSIQNVLGIFTNDGNVELKPNTSYVTSGRSLEMHAAVVAFNSNLLNDGSGEIEGSIVYTASTSPGGSDKWKLVGSRVQSKINNIGYTQRNIFFDVRFAGGKFAPPFFPGTVYDLGEESVAGEIVIANIDAPKATGLSWVRVNN